jgi:hypothetical protein
MWLELLNAIDEMLENGEIDQFDQIDIEKLLEITQKLLDK